MLGPTHLPIAASPPLSLRGVYDEAISTSEVKIASLALAMTERKRTHASHFLSLLLIILISFPLITSAQAPDPQPVNTVLTNFLALLTIVIKILISLAFVVFGWGVVTFILASNDEKKIREAKNIILLGIIGIFVLASMGGIIIFIKTYFGIPDNSPIQPPTFTTFLASHANRI